MHSKLQHLSPPPSPSQLREEVLQARALSSDRSGLQALLEQAGRRSSQLERELGERERELGEQAAQASERPRLLRELEEVRGARHALEQRLAQCLQDGQQSQAELAGLEAILALLHLREVLGAGSCLFIFGTSLT